MWTSWQFDYEWILCHSHWLIAYFSIKKLWRFCILIKFLILEHFLEVLHLGFGKYVISKKENLYLVIWLRHLLNDETLFMSIEKPIKHWFHFYYLQSTYFIFQKEEWTIAYKLFAVTTFSSIMIVFFCWGAKAGCPVWPEFFCQNQI